LPAGFACLSPLWHAAVQRKAAAVAAEND